MKKLLLHASLLSLSLAAFVSAVSIARPSDSTQLRVVPVEELKEIYLKCDQLAATTFLSFYEAAICSMVSDELLTRGFGNNFEQLLQWWRSAQNKCTQPDGCESP